MPAHQAVRRSSPPQRIVGATILCLLLTAQASASVKFELSIHDAARTARKQKFETLLLVTRSDIRADLATDKAGVLRAVEKMALNALAHESGVRGVTDSTVRSAAASAKYSRPLQSPETTSWLEMKPADAILNLDFSDRGNSLQLTLVDPSRIYFSATVSLDSRPEPISEKELGSSDVTKPGDATETKAETDHKPVKKATKKEMPSKTTKQAANGAAQKGPKVPFGPDGRPPATGDKQFGTGRRVARTGFTGDFVRSTQFGEASSSSNGGSQKSSQTSSQTQTSRNGQKTTSNSKSSTNETSTTSPANPGNQGIGPLNEEVLSYSIENIGRKVGRGECWDLAAEALRAAGAEPARGYTFGDPVPLEEIKAGDILQFTSARFDEPGFYTTMGFPHHTAVVYSQTPDRTYILQQNFGGQRVVSTYDLNLNNLTQGSLEAFRPRPRQPGTP